MIDRGEFAISPRHEGSTNTIIPEFIVGANYPWFKCGHDFGREPYYSGSGQQPIHTFDASLAATAFPAIANLGVKVLRWWILAAGLNYPPSANEARAAFERRGEQFYPLHGVDLPVLDAHFTNDFRRLCRACRNAGLKLIPSLMSFEWFWPHNRSGYRVTRGRSAVVFESRGRMREFLDATLAPLLDASRDFRDVIYAWELINEPEWAVAGSGHIMTRDEYDGIPWLGRVISGDVSPADMCALIDAALTMIQDAGFLSTVGFAFTDLDWLSSSLRRRLIRDGANGRYIHQLHHYPTTLDDEPLPRHSSLTFKPCIVGEFPTGAGGTASNEVWADQHLAEDDSRSYLRKRLELIQSSGYPMALFWSATDDPHEPRSPWTEVQKQQVAEFTGHRPLRR